MYSIRKTGKEMKDILSINNLRVNFRIGQRDVSVLRGVDLSLGKGDVLGIVGESGSGKSLTALSILKLLPRRAFFAGGTILLNNINIIQAPEKDMAGIRGSTAGMIFQEPASYLNPVYTAGNQVVEAVKRKMSKKEAEKSVFNLFREIGLEERNYFQYPHQLSGGMQQRVMIAMAIINNPVLLIADEPTTALDVTTAIQIIELLKALIEKHGLSVFFITHDISLAEFFCDRVAVMYAGQIVEIGDSRSVFNTPRHPYTQGLISCMPDKYTGKGKLRAIEGSVPDFRELPRGCAFHPRCPLKKPVCERYNPAKTKVDRSIVRCFLYGDAKEEN